ncbi:uncharacterized protein DS421_16g542820 [Arachis hypogaea]|nr:uncharacterized protein DS421_16g542820 [Arachis hypogaea]
MLAVIESNPDGKTLLELVYGSKLLAKVANVDSQVTCDIPCGDDGQSLIGGREAMIVDTAVENANCVVEETPEIMLEREGNRGAQDAGSSTEVENLRGIDDQSVDGEDEI